MSLYQVLSSVIRGSTKAAKGATTLASELLPGLGRNGLSWLRAVRAKAVAVLLSRHSLRLRRELVTAVLAHALKDGLLLVLVPMLEQIGLAVQHFHFQHLLQVIALVIVSGTSPAAMVHLLLWLLKLSPLVPIPIL